MSKIKMVRQSGNPVDLDQLKKFEAEFKSGYDDIMDEYGNDMKNVHDALQAFDEVLSAKYDTIMEIDAIESAAAQKTLVNKYGPIMITTNTETGELVYVVLDMGM